jgi:hypothetical protein
MFRTLIAMLFFCTAASAAQIPSAATGVYLGPDRICDIILKRHTSIWDGVSRTWWTQVEFDCRLFSGGERQRSLTTLYAPQDPCQGVDQVAWSLAPYLPSGEYLRLIHWQGATMTVVRGTDINAVTNGIGTFETWTFVTALDSPAPYSCSVSTRDKPRG